MNRNTWIIILVAVAVIIGLLVVFNQPAQTPVVPATPSSAVSSSSAPPASVPVESAVSSAVSEASVVVESAVSEASSALDNAASDAASAFSEAASAFNDATTPSVEEAPAMTMSVAP
jgi:hypothetical protein